MDNFDKKTLRLFIGVKPEFDRLLSEKFSELKNILHKSTVKWAPDANLHLTLAFLGDINTSKVEIIKQCIHNSISGIGPFKLTFRSFGTFGKPYPKVIWVGLDDNAELMHIFSELRKNLADEKFEIDNREFSPHLTLGRIKYLSEQNKLTDFITANRNIPLSKSEINSVFLFSSTLKPEGPQYTVLSAHQF